MSAVFESIGIDERRSVSHFHPLIGDEIAVRVRIPLADQIDYQKGINCRPPQIQFNLRLSLPSDC
jgi:hypothetical protein